MRQSGIFATPRPVPGRLLPTVGGAFVIALALPVFLLVGWSVAGWALAAVLWAGLRGVDLLLVRLGPETGRLAPAGVLAFGLMFKAIVVLAVLVAAATSHPRLAVAAALTYALAYTFELGLSLASYFGGAAR